MLLATLSRRLGLQARAAWAAPGAAAGSSALLHTSPTAAASVQVKIPPLGESISDGTVAAVLKQPGDKVEEDEPILQIETDKVCSHLMACVYAYSDSAAV
jgi:2-oxoglutarate dehydrogenase E2 component (dihydrolipoamide succinyltransferase)